MPRLQPLLALCLTLAAGSAGGLVGCNPPAEGLREWRADDHDREDDPNGAKRASGAAPAQKSNPEAEAAQLVDVTWRNQCTSCHGPLGHGDGPQAPQFHPADLARPDWQESVSDQQIAQIVQSGKNKMPKFDLPPAVLKGIVARVRSLKGR